MQTIRSPAVAGLFYPGAAQTLAQDVRAMLAAVQPHDFVPKALIVPHAGYVYPGSVAASAYATLAAITSNIRRVVLLGPTHRVAVRGLALPGADAFATPLGISRRSSQGARAVVGRRRNAGGHQLRPFPLPSI